MILVLSVADDPHAEHVVRRLRERGAAVTWFDPARFPAAAELSATHAVDGRAQYSLRDGGEPIDLSTVTAAWYRRPGRPVAPPDLPDPVVRAELEQECETFVQDVWNALGCAWVPGPRAVVQRAHWKTSQLRLAGELGFELPPTLVTNSPAEFLAFYRQHEGNLISKQAGYAFRQVFEQGFGRFTEPVTRRDVGYASAIRFCPVIFQAYVPKHVELRVTVVDQHVFAAEIHSQTTNHTRLDWRRYDPYHTPYAPHALPEEVAARCRRLVERLGLTYGAIDLILTPDGRYVFLEINPNGQYLWIEQATGLPISEALCDLLLAGQPAAPAAIPAGVHP